MDFKKIDFSVLPIIKDFFDKQTYMVCDFTIGGLYMWIDYFTYEYCLMDDVLFIRSNKENDIQYALPLGNTEKGIKILKEKYGEILFNVVPKEALPYFYEAKEKTELPDWFDYVYKAKDLISLTGKKYKEKRNLLHHFCNTYEYEYVNVLKVNDILVEWDNMFKKDSDLAKYEMTQTKDVLDDYNKYDFVGGTLYVNNRVVAFCVGEIQGETLFVHIEKVNKAYNGAYQAINCFFVKDISERYGIKYVNREEDVGDLGLRKAKVSYNPFMMKEKYKVKL